VQEGSPYIGAQSENLNFKYPLPYNKYSGSSSTAWFVQVAPPTAALQRQWCWQNIEAGLRTPTVSFHSQSDVNAGLVKRSQHTIRCNARNADYWVQPFTFPKGSQVYDSNYLVYANGEWSNSYANLPNFPNTCEGFYAIRHCVAYNSASGKFNDQIDNTLDFVGGVVVTDRCSVDITTPSSPFVRCSQIYKNNNGNETIEEQSSIVPYCLSSGCANQDFKGSTAFGSAAASSGGSSSSGSGSDAIQLAQVANDEIPVSCVG